MSASLLHHVEPLFQAVCRLNRIGRINRGGATTIEYTQARTEMEEMFDVLSRTARGDLTLGEQYRQVEMALLIFVDAMIGESALPFAAKWNENRLATARGERNPDEKFFQLLDETLQDRSPAADERLAAFYICLGLGYTGAPAGTPGQGEFLRKKMAEIGPRVKAYVDADESAFITPASYQHTNLANLPLPMAASLVPLLIILSGLLLVVVAVNVYTFHSASSELNDALSTITAHDPSKATSKP